MKNLELGKSSRVSLIIFAMFILSLVSKESFACTGILTKTQDNNYIFARTMEFGTDLMTFDLIAVPRNYKFTGQAPSGKPGMAWETKYGYTGFNPFGALLVADGLNEKGLFCGVFYLPGYTKYEDVSEKDYPNTISCLDLPSWILGTCATVSEVKEKLPKIHVCSFEVPGEISPPLRYMLADATGDAIIVEYAEGKLNIYNNEVNAITNSPNYPWHLTNLKNYIGLKPLNNPEIKINGTEIIQFGQGSGAIGLPGDFTPPSRFVRAVFFANTAFPGKDVDEGIGVAFHILNQFDIPRGSIRGNESGKVVSDTTQWTSASDLTNRRYFYHTYNDRSVRVIDLKKINLNSPKIMSIKDIQSPGKIKDVSHELK